MKLNKEKDTESGIKRKSRREARRRRKRRRIEIGMKERANRNSYR